MTMTICLRLSAQCKLVQQGNTVAVWFHSYSSVFPAWDLRLLSNAELSNAHFDEPTAIGSGCAVHEHVLTVCLRAFVQSTQVQQGDTVQHSFICTKMYSWHKTTVV